MRGEIACGLNFWRKPEYALARYEMRMIPTAVGVSTFVWTVDNLVSIAGVIQVDPQGTSLAEAIPSGDADRSAGIVRNDKINNRVWQECLAYES
jgi:hypothetical protein